MREIMKHPFHFICESVAQIGARLVERPNDLREVELAQ